MKILYVATIGGFMPFFKDLVKKLIDEGHTVDFAANQSSAKVPEYYREWGCNVYDISCSRSPFSFGNIKAIKQIRNLARRYDVVHCHTPIAGIATRIACRRLRKKQNLKVIYTAHGFHFYKGAPKKNWILYYPFEKICSRWTDLLITINKEDFELAKKKMHAKEIEYVAGVGIDTKKFDRTNKHTLNKADLGMPTDAFVVLSVGELNRNKNHQIVVKALSKINNSRYFYVIAGKGDQHDDLIQLAQTMHVNLKLLGFRKDVDELYAMSDCYVLPSLREGLNVSIMEAMSSGLPVVCSNIRGNVDLVDTHGGFLCNPHSIDDFADAIKSVKKEMGEYNVKKIEAYDSSVINKRMVEIYENITHLKFK